MSTPSSVVVVRDIDRCMERADQFFDKNNFVTALKYYKLAAKHNYLEAHLMVAHIIEKYVLTKSSSIKIKEEKPLEVFLENLKKAALKGSTDANCRLGRLYFFGEYGIECNYKSAYEWFLQGALKGAEEALYYVGLCYLKGLGREKNEKTGITYLQRAREKYHVMAIVELANSYEHGIGVEKDLKQVFLLYQEASTQSKRQETNPKTIRIVEANLARCYENGIGIEPDLKSSLGLQSQMSELSLDTDSFEEELEKVKQAIEPNKDKIEFLRCKYLADEGNVVSMRKVASYYMDGYGIPQNVTAAHQYLETAAKSDGESALMMGRDYLSGFGLKKDHRKATQLFKRAYVEHKYEPAGYYLGLVYVLYGTKEDYVKGCTLLTCFADKGDWVAKSRLGWCFMYGRGVELNIPRAIEIFESCLKNDSEDIFSRNVLAEALMTAKCGQHDRPRAFLLLKQTEAIFEKNPSLKDETTYQLLAKCFLAGLGVEKDQEKVVSYLKMAADLKDNFSKAMLAIFEFQKSQEPTRRETLEENLKKIARENCHEAFNALGIFTLAGTFDGGKAGKEKVNLKKAFNLFNQAIDTDSFKILPDAVNNVGWCYLNGLGVEQDFTKAVKCFKEGIAKGSTTSMNNLAWCYLNGFGVEKDIKQAKRWFLAVKRKQLEDPLLDMLGIACLGYFSIESEVSRLENLKDISQYNNLARCYLRGWGVGEDVKKALEMLHGLMRDHKSLEAMMELGLYYMQAHEGEKLEDSGKKAFEIFASILQEVEKSRKNVDEQYLSVVKFNAYVQIALCKIYGHGVKKNTQKGLELMDLCAKVGHPIAQFYMGIFCASGLASDDLGSQDKKPAFEYFRLAAAQGLAIAQRYLASFMDEGKMVERDVKAIIELYQNAADQGDAISENNLATLLAERGNQQNLEQILQYYHYSAQCSDNVLAWHNLGICYELGLGIAPNRTLAITYYRNTKDKLHQSQMILKELELQTEQQNTNQRKSIEAAPESLEFKASLSS